VPIVTAEKKKGRAAAATEYVFDPIDVDMPFSAAEVAALTSEAYVAALGPSDMPVVGHWGQFAPSARKVLVVDDETIVVNSIRKILSRKGSRWKRLSPAKMPSPSVLPRLRPGTS